jgi:tetratricopeptide (TPR) repeat protein
MLKPLRDHIETTRRTDHRSEAIVDHFLALALTGNHLDEATDPCIIYTLTAEYPNVCWAIQSALSDNFHDAVMAVIGLARFAVVTGSARVESGDLLIEARNKSRQMGEIQLEALCVRELGDIARSQDELHEQAIKHFEEAITLCELAGDQSSKGWCLKGLGDIFDNRDYKEAEKFYGLAIDCFQDCNDKRGLGWCYRGLAEIYRTVQIDLTKSEHYYRTALPLFQDCGVRRGEGWCVSGFGELAKLRKEDQTAKSYYDQATEIFQTCGDQRSEAWCRWCLGEIASSTSEAYLLYEEGRKMFQNAGAKRGEAWCLLGLGETDLRDEDLEQAREHLTSARTLFQTFGDTRGIDRCAEALSRLTNI